jgi:hypothetical protein
VKAGSGRRDVDDVRICRVNDDAPEAAVGPESRRTTLLARETDVCPRARGVGGHVDAGARADPHDVGIRRRHSDGRRKWLRGFGKDRLPGVAVVVGFRDAARAIGDVDAPAGAAIGNRDVNRAAAVVGRTEVRPLQVSERRRPLHGLVLLEAGDAKVLAQRGTCRLTGSERRSRQGANTGRVDDQARGEQRGKETGGQ